MKYRLCDAENFWLKESIKHVQFADSYELETELGRGATAIVYKCRCKKSGKSWAVKIINKKVEKRIVCMEIGVLLKLEHPNIIHLKEVFENATVIYLVLELVTGGELFERVVSCGYYNERESIRCVSDILKALKYLHENGIIHRDLKPENLLYENDSDVSNLKIADFGLSKILSPETLMKTVCGTPGYCAPEVLKGEVYDSSVDMWSLGVITYILLCGYEPFYGDSETEVFRKILRCQYAFDEPWWDDVSTLAKDFVSRLLSEDAKRRMSVHEALHHPWINGHSLFSSKETRLEVQSKLKEFNSRRKLKAVMMAARINRNHQDLESNVPKKTTQ